MSSGKSDQDIIAEQAVSLDSKSRSDRPEKFSTKDTVTSDESNVNESNLQEFEGVNVSTGRTGQNGGGTNAQLIPPEEGGEGVAGTSSAIYDDARGGKSDIQADIHRNNPGVSRTGDNPNIQKETGIAGARPAQELEDQPRSSTQA